MKYIFPSSMPEVDGLRSYARNITYSYVGMAHRARPFLAAIAIVVALTVLSGYWFQSQIHRPVPDYPGTHPLTAFMLLLLGFCVLTHRLLKPVTRLRKVALVTVIGLSAARLLEIAFGSVTRPVSRVFETVVGAGASVDWVETGDNTAMSTGLLAISLLLYARAPRLAMVASMAAIFIALLGMAGYVFNIGVLFGAMSPVTLVAIVPLTLGTATIFAHRRIYRMVLSDTPVGLIARTQILMSSLLLLGIAADHWSGDHFSATLQNVLFALTLWLIGVMNIITSRVYDRIDRRRRKVERDLVRIALIDPLTGAANRHGLDSYFNSLHRQRDLGVVLIDLDHFKSVNDRYGHKAGDRILGEVSNALRKRLRDRDVLARWGGEEFLALLHDVDEKDLEIVAQDLRRIIDDLADPAGEVDRFTASFGVTLMDRSEESLDSAITRADRALYWSKDMGRNRVTYWRDLPNAVRYGDERVSPLPIDAHEILVREA
ncbi:hypothetical protein DI396_05350 [Litorivita pollutaquae]|uniref:diguanylate cyclase n=1 Tax=Litorivita pollutaquae TaxID=2200892 RepID=A0A2V4MVS1_9RHOB|nr:GGDEF domain-containing protein [Litorivita pollutaquae]PYC48408.1 hypothetical protein DI396_05350 [Litorivita pollutaquae]